VILDPPRRGNCEEELLRFLDEYEQARRPFGPALVFLDQFGYSAVSMNLIGRVLAYPRCEVFSYLDYKDMNRWISDGTKASAFARAYGGIEWQQAVDLPEPERRIALWDMYKNALHSRANAKYVYRFAMFDKYGSPLYWLVFCTNNLRGLEVMKRAMWKVDKTGGFKFSDMDNRDQLRLLDEKFDEQWLAAELASRFAGKELTVAEVKEHVLIETPCYLFKGALEMLETAEEPELRIVHAPAKRRCGKFPDADLAKIRVRFRDAGLS
jgi:hypothetical protein